MCRQVFSIVGRNRQPLENCHCNIAFTGDAVAMTPVQRTNYAIQVGDTNTNLR